MMRAFVETDFDACVDLYITTFAGEPWNELWDLEVVRARLKQLIQTPGFLGIVTGDEPLSGFALGVSEPWHEGGHFYLKEMCVRPSLQRQGLGTRLLKDLCEEIRASGATRIYLLTARDGISESFYSKAGFYTSPKMILMAHRFQPPD